MSLEPARGALVRVADREQRASSNGRPAICMPSGKPLLLNPQGSAIAGAPVTLNIVPMLGVDHFCAAPMLRWRIQIAAPVRRRS